MLHATDSLIETGSLGDSGHFGLRRGKNVRIVHSASICAGRPHGLPLLLVRRVVIAMFAVCTLSFSSRNQLFAVRQDDLLPFWLNC